MKGAVLVSFVIALGCTSSNAAEYEAADLRPPKKDVYDYIQRKIVDGTLSEGHFDK
jgi:hypothetical protein